jgi:hypothetical protein
MWSTERGSILILILIFFFFDILNVQATINEIKKYPEQLAKFPPIRVMRINNHYWSLDNRRLYVHLSCSPFSPLLCILEPPSEANLDEFRVKKKSVDGGVPRFGHY